MSVTAYSPQDQDDVEVLAGALYCWCAERSIKMKSQEGLSVANLAIDLYMAGHRTQDQLFWALQEQGFH